MATKRPRFTHTQQEPPESKTATVCTVASKNRNRTNSGHPEFARCSARFLESLKVAQNLNLSHFFGSHSHYFGGAPSTVKQFRSEIRNKSGNTPETLSEQILNFHVSYGWRSSNLGKQSRFPPQINFRIALPPVRLVPFPFLEGPPPWNSQSRPWKKTAHPNKKCLRKQLAQAQSSCFLRVLKGEGLIICVNCSEIVCANCAFIWAGRFYRWASPSWKSPFKYRTNAAFTRTFSKSSCDLSFSLWHKSGTQRKLFRKPRVQMNFDILG